MEPHAPKNTTAIGVVFDVGLKMSSCLNSKLTGLRRSRMRSKSQFGAGSISVAITLKRFRRDARSLACRAMTQTGLMIVPFIENSLSSSSRLTMIFFKYLSLTPLRMTPQKDAWRYRSCGKPGNSRSHLSESSLRCRLKACFSCFSLAILPSLCQEFQ